MTYLLITKKMYHIQGDERSETHPGHGYPAHTDSFDEVRIITDENELKTKIKRLTESKTPFSVFSGEKLKVDVVTDVKLNVHSA